MRFTYFHPDYGTREFERSTSEIIIGRPRPNQRIDLDLTPDKHVSRPHARMLFADDAYWIEDLGSTHGTWVNGQRIETPTQIEINSSVQVGRTVITLLQPEEVLAETEMDTTFSLRESAQPQESDNPFSIEPATPPPAVVAPDISPERGRITVKLDATRSPFSSAATGSPADLIIQARRFYDLSQALGQELSEISSLEQLLTVLVEQLKRAFPMAQRGAVLISDQDGVLLLKHHWPLGKPAVSMTLAQRASRERVAFIWSDEEENPESVIYYNMQSAMYAPLLYRNQVLGVLCIDNQETFDAFTELECDLLRIFANQAALYIKNQMLQQDLQREAAARSNLLRQFPPSVAERMLRQSGRLRLTGEQIAPVTILESDVRGFTTLSATMEPCDVVQMLNEMFCSLTPIIFRYDGVIDKYVGDAILAVFGSPDPDQKQCEKAVLAAIEMQRAMDDLGRRWKSRGITHCDVKIGIGIHSGAVVHGFVGSPERMEYTVIGDTVNRASRLCDGAKPGDVVISKKVYERVFNIIDVVPQIIKTKHPDREPDIEAYAIKGLISQRGFNP